MKSLIIICIIMLLFASYSNANNIQVSSPTLLNQNTGNHTTFVQFSVSWDNSFRDVINRDAAWIFIKFRVGANGLWKHATLTSTTNIPAGAIFDVPSDNKGGFLYRNAQGSGSVNYANIQLQWNYGADGVNDNAGVIVKVFAIEMVYIPQGSFWVGDGSLNNVTGQFSQGNTTLPYLITSEGALTLGGGNPQNLSNRNAFGMLTPDDFNNLTTQILPAAYPKGYNAFYVMKYKISQQQYVDYLNTLTRLQQQYAVNSNVSTDAITNIYVMSNTSILQSRNTIVCPASGNGTLSPIIFSMNPVRNDRACGGITWNQGVAYTDWAALSLFTELEYEKMCRGDQNPVVDEYPWGTTNITQATTISGTENGTETITNGGANCSYGNFNFSGGDGGFGPLRSGIFAKNGNTREQSGASYYGVMDLGSGLYERCFSVGSPAERSFDGSNGDGDVYSLQFGWVYGTGPFRGGAFDAGTSYLRVSDRYYINDFSPFYLLSYGFRCARTAPTGTFNGPNLNEKNKN